MRKTRVFPLSAVLLLLLLPPFPAGAELVGSQEYGYSLDLPEGFVLTGSTAGGSGYQFQNVLCPVQLTVRVYGTDEFASAQKAMDSTLTRLSAAAETSQVEWRGTECVLAQFRMQLGGAGYGGWGVSVRLPEGKGFLTLLAYAATSDGRGGDPSAMYEPLILSAVDSVYVDRGSFFECGPVTAFAFPPAGEEAVMLDVDGTQVATVLDRDDADASRFVTEREFSVMRMFADTELWLQAWQRYYRQIYRDAYGRLKRPAFDIYAALRERAAEEGAESGPEFLARTLLGWVQGFGYKRDFRTSDLAPLPAVLAGRESSDCDSRALLLAVLLRQMNMDTALFVSPVYSHAMLGVRLDLGGARIAVDGKDYLLGETTARVPLGMVAEDMSVTENWIPVVFP